MKFLWDRQVLEGSSRLGGVISASAVKKTVDGEDWMTSGLYGANGEGRTPMAFRPPDPKSGASASSATFA